MYMEVPKGFNINNSKEYVLKLKKNLYGQKQAGRVWNKHLVTKLASIGFKQSLTDKCIFYRGQTIFVLYTDDSILTAASDTELDSAITDMKKSGLELMVEEGMSDFLGVQIEHTQDGFWLTQLHLIRKILEDLRLDDNNVTPKAIPAPSSIILHRHLDDSPFDNHFSYQSVIGKLNYLEKSS